MGQIINLITVDAQKFQDIPVLLHMFWSAPLIIGVAMYFLWKELGPAAFVGLGILLILIPINVLLGQITRPLQVVQMTQKDSRIKMTNEILSGIKVFTIHSFIHTTKSD